MPHEKNPSVARGNRHLSIAEHISRHAARLPGVPALRQSPQPRGIAQRVKGLKKGDNVKVHLGIEVDPIVKGVILEVQGNGEYYKVQLEGGEKAETYLEKVVYSASMDDGQINEINAEQVREAIRNEGRFDLEFPTRKELPKKKAIKFPSAVSRPEKETGNDDEEISKAFNGKIEEYINGLKVVAGKLSEGFSFDGKIITIPGSLGAKQREGKAKELGLRYNKVTRILSFAAKDGKIEEVSVEDGESQLENHEQKVRRLKGEYDRAKEMGLEAELEELLKNKMIIAAYEKDGAIDNGQLGELRAARLLKNKYDKTYAGQYLLLGSVHFWGEKSTSNKLNDISNELDHLVICGDGSERYRVKGVYNTKAGPNLQAQAGKQNISARKMLEHGSKGEYRWTDEEGIIYTLKAIEGVVDQGPEELLGQPFELKLGGYDVDEGVELGTIGPTKHYDIQLSNTGVLANALTYCLLANDPRFKKYYSGEGDKGVSSSRRGKEKKPDREKDLQQEKIVALEERMRGKALFEAEQLGEPEDEFAEWDELWPYLGEKDKLQLQKAWKGEL